MLQKGWLLLVMSFEKDWQLIKLSESKRLLFKMKMNVKLQAAVSAIL